MSFLTQLETRLRWLAFPSLLRALAVIHFVMLLLLMAKPALGGAMFFDWGKIMDGEVWRLICYSFLISYVDPNATAGFSMFGVLFGFFAMMIAFLFNDALESTWGIFRTSLYIYLVVIGQTVANILLSVMGLPAEPIGGRYIYLAAFFAFATLFPRHTFMVMFVIPVQVWILAAIMGALLILNAITSPYFAFFSFLTFAPYLWWAIPLALKAIKDRKNMTIHKARHRSLILAEEGTSFHLCQVCGATEHSHPEQEFRIGENDEEICLDCLAD